MYLEDVTIEGFKSFSEPTTMSFEPGIGVIIGNNGVGKSNILDALAWALGEDDLRRLRCRTREDLFFSGSDLYPPAECARVELVFRGTPWGDLCLCREVRRNGEEAFWIGGDRMEPDGYRDGLERLGLSGCPRTIVRQEGITDILKMEAAERFRWFQELARIGDPDEAARVLAGRVAGRFERCLELLDPRLKGRIRVEGDGAPGLEFEMTFPGVARPRPSHQLSGGQQAVTSLAFKLAAFEEVDSPLYLLDEVEPSLDYGNHKSIQALLKDLAGRRQLIMITHLRATIDVADTVHGVRTRRDGSSFMKFYFLMDERVLRLFRCSCSRNAV